MKPQLLLDLVAYNVRASSSLLIDEPDSDVLTFKWFVASRSHLIRNKQPWVFSAIELKLSRRAVKQLAPELLVAVAVEHVNFQRGKPAGQPYQDTLWLEVKYDDEMNIRSYSVWYEKKPVTGSMGLYFEYPSLEKYIAQLSLLKSVKKSRTERRKSKVALRARANANSILWHDGSAGASVRWASELFDDVIDNTNRNLEE